MLKQLGRLERTRNIIILGFAVIMAVSLVMFYAPQRNAQYVEPSKNTQVVAKVGRDEITVADIAQQKQSIQDRFGGQISLAQLGYSDQVILEQLVAERVLAQEAERLGFRVPDVELEEGLAKEFSDPSGKFLFIDASGNRDITRYREIVTSRYGSVERYEEGRRRAYEANKLRAFITASVNVADEEVQADYKRKNTTFDLTSATISAEKQAEKVQPSDQELRTYYDQHKTDYRILVPQKRIRYIFIDQEKSGEKLQIPEKDLRDEYEKLSPEHKQAGVKVQQILLKVARKDLDSQVEQKAKDLLVKLRDKNGQASEQAFADAARGNSEDPATAKNGGFLSHLVKKNPNKPDAFYERAVDMQPGDVSDIPIKYAGNWYILRRGDSVPKTFEEAKQELLVSLRNRRGYVEAQKIATRAQARLKETHDAQKVAQELAADANMKPADMMRETGYIKPGDDVKDIGSNQQFEQAIAPLNKPNDVGEKTGIKNGFAIPMFVDKKEPRIPEFDEVKDKVTQALKQQRAKEQLDQKARDLAASVNSAADLKAAAEKAGFEAETQEGYKLGGTLGKAGTSPALDEAIYKLKEGGITKDPIKVDDNWVVVGAIKRKEADLAEFAKQRDQLTQSMLRSRQEQVFGDYIASVVDRLKREGKIKIYKEVLSSIAEDEPAAMPQPRRPRFPIPTK
jgi:peptidyl-prolyl cis-trans isomerase D